jgi:ABC-2 type transport system permease protein
VLVITSEYSTGTIRSTLLAVPTRLPMLAAKSVVLAALIFVATEAIAIASFFLGVAILHAKVPVSLGDPGVLRVILGMGLYLTMLGLFSMAIGGLFRNTVAGITGVIAFVMVLPVLSQLLPGSLVKHVHAYLPTEAGGWSAKRTNGPAICSPHGRASGCSAYGRRCSSLSAPSPSDAATPEPPLSPLPEPLLG